jgi:hypothetical protein
MINLVGRPLRLVDLLELSLMVNPVQLLLPRLPIPDHLLGKALHPPTTMELDRDSNRITPLLKGNINDSRLKSRDKVKVTARVRVRIDCINHLGSLILLILHWRGVELDILLLSLVVVGRLSDRVPKILTPLHHFHRLYRFLVRL